MTTGSTLDIVMPDGSGGSVAVHYVSTNGTYAVVKLSGTPHKGTVDVFHVGTGLRVEREDYHRHLDEFVRTL